MRLQLPGDTSPHHVACWETEYQPAGKQRVGLQLPEGSAAQAVDRRSRRESWHAQLTGACGSLSVVNGPAQLKASLKQSLGVFSAGPQHISEGPRIIKHCLQRADLHNHVHLGSRQHPWATWEGALSSSFPDKVL